MIFYKVKFLSLPEIKFASSSYTDHFKNVVTNRENMLELGIVDGTTESEDMKTGKISTSTGKRISAIMPDRNFRIYAPPSEHVRITTVAICGSFDYERIECDDPELCKKYAKEDKDCILLPLGLKIDLEYILIENAIRKICLLFPKEGEGNKMHALSVFFEILAMVDEMVRKTLAGETKESICIYYSKKTKKYIDTHYSEKISVAEIAGILQVTQNYLSRIFKEETKQTITEYTARLRLAKARELLYENSSDLNAVAKAVGLSDSRHLNRLFKKYYGTSTHKCILVDREISLYHNKPWETDRLEEDIFDKESL